MQSLTPHTGNSEPDGSGVPFIEFVSGSTDTIDASGLVYDDPAQPNTVYGQLRFIDGAPRAEVVAMLRAAADFFETDHFA